MLIDSFAKTNEEVGKQNFDVSFSGTTAVTVIFSGTRLVCANVGDSRAVLGTLSALRLLKGGSDLPSHLQNEGNKKKIWRAVPLSRDHKPDEADEHLRIIQHKGRIEPFREQNGDPVGPSRVWLADENVPGLAMSRSLGDRVATEAGVICTPEVFESQITVDDKFVIIASDGLWEFVANGEAVEMVAPYWEHRNPEGACDKLIAEAVRRWQKEDEVIDDITVVVIFLAQPDA